jgi:DNA-binding transcriptional MerR regulator
MRIGEVAGRAAVPAKTIRFWEDQHLLPPPARTPGGYRDYDPAILERLAFIRHAQAAGLTLDAIRQVLDIGDGGQPPCVHVAGLIARRLTEVEARLAELARTRDQLAALAARAAAQDPADCRGYCSIIAAEAPPAALDLPATGKAQRTVRPGQAARPMEPQQP